MSFNFPVFAQFFFAPFSAKLHIILLLIDIGMVWQISRGFCFHSDSYIKCHLYLFIFEIEMEGTYLFSLHKLLSFTKWNKKIMDSMIEYGYIWFLEIRTTLITVFGNDFLDWKTTHTQWNRNIYLAIFFERKLNFFFGFIINGCYLRLLSN